MDYWVQTVIYQFHVDPFWSNLLSYVLGLITVIIVRWFPVPNSDV